MLGCIFIINQPAFPNRYLIIIKLPLPIPDLVNYHAPIFMDGWNSNNGEYIALLAEAPFALESTWKLIWDQKVSFVVTILTSVSKVSRSG